MLQLLCVCMLASVLDCTWLMVFSSLPPADLLYVLKFILGDFCIVCTGFHVVNFSMLVVAIFEYRAVEPEKKKRF